MDTPRSENIDALLRSVEPTAIPRVRDRRRGLQCEPGIVTVGRVVYYDTRTLDRHRTPTVGALTLFHRSNRAAHDDAGTRCLASPCMSPQPQPRPALLPLLAPCVQIWFSTGSLTVIGLYLLVALALCYPRIRAAARWLPAAPLVRLALGLMGFDLHWAWTDAVDVIAQVAELVHVISQQVPARAPELELVVCPTCLGTGRDPEAPDAIADDDGTCPGCCDPRHPHYAAHHGRVRPV